MNPDPGTTLSRRTFLRHSSAAFVAGTLEAPLGFPVLLRGASDDRPLRLGLISAASYGYLGAPRTPGSNHGTAFATCCNGFDAAKRKAFTGTFVAAQKRLPGVRVVKIWDPLQSAAAQLADICGIPEVCATADECSEGVDAVAIVDDGSGEQWRHALVPLRRGVPTFCDKPLAMTAKAAQAVANVARASGTPFMSAIRINDQWRICFRWAGTDAEQVEVIDYH